MTDFESQRRMSTTKYWSEDTQWRTSKKGNLWTQIEGATLTIFPTDKGFRGIIVTAKDGNEKHYTTDCTNEYDVQQELYYLLWNVLEKSEVENE